MKPQFSHLCRGWEEGGKYNSSGSIFRISQDPSTSHHATASTWATPPTRSLPSSGCAPTQSALPTQPEGSLSENIWSQLSSALHPHGHPWGKARPYQAWWQGRSHFLPPHSLLRTPLQQTAPCLLLLFRAISSLILPGPSFYNALPNVHMTPSPPSGLCSNVTFSVRLSLTSSSHHTDLWRGGRKGGTQSVCMWHATHNHLWDSRSCPECWSLNLTLPFTRCVTLGKVLNHYRVLCHQDLQVSLIGWIEPWPGCPAASWQGSADPPSSTFTG